MTKAEKADKADRPKRKAVSPQKLSYDAPEKKKRATKKAPAAKKAEKGTKKAGKGKKAKKDPDAPKRALSAFMFFSSDVRASIKEKNPTATFTEQGKLIGEAWRNLTDAEKAKYNAKHEKDKKRYEKEMAEYKPAE
eukprot:CAMPEP_0177681402 /NCGR_PEP_ID=MMETSP0447-20121125/30699_1 /TAXON_ID=0 /ORGANISM="Stygamoeba regulata, Strain BSH-02190019" /LENGTH=135 /DNA_ID=CAMNT_0019190821 /DNA_START=19 /DNA_END=426 /DNA_ORIENTATION=+